MALCHDERDFAMGFSRINPHAKEDAKMSFKKTGNAPVIGAPIDLSKNSPKPDETQVQQPQPPPVETQKPQGR
jgi:hypothetical protein